MSRTRIDPSLLNSLSSNLIFSPTTNGIQGTATNDNASTGVVGEFIGSTIGNTNAGSTGVTVNLTSISLTAGDWDVSCIAQCQPNGATVSDFDLAIGTTSAGGQTLGDQALRAFPNGATEIPIAIPLVRISIASTTTVYLTLSVDYTGSGARVIGANLRARRVR